MLHAHLWCNSKLQLLPQTVTPTCICGYTNECCTACIHHKNAINSLHALRKHKKIYFHFYHISISRFWTIVGLRQEACNLYYWYNGRWWVGGGKCGGRRGWVLRVLIVSKFISPTLPEYFCNIIKMCHLFDRHDYNHNHSHDDVCLDSIGQTDIAWTPGNAEKLCNLKTGQWLIRSYQPSRPQFKYMLTSNTGGLLLVLF